MTGCGKAVLAGRKSQFELDCEGLVFASGYTFAKVMADNPDLARRFAERLLDIKIGTLEFFEVETSIPAVLRKSVRMDAVLAGTGEVVEIEMQTVRCDDFERRLRYYQAMIDTRALGKGQLYKDLPELYMLSICQYDHFGSGLALYRFELKCEDDPTANFNNGVHVVIANTSASMTDVPPEVRSLLKYVKTNEPVEGDDLTMELADATRQAYADEGWVGSIMTTEMLLRVKESEAIERGLKKGIEQGIEQGIAQGIEQGEQRIEKLVNALLGASRIDDLQRQVKDEAFRESLYEEFGL